MNHRILTDLIANSDTDTLNKLCGLHVMGWELRDNIHPFGNHNRPYFYGGDPDVAKEWVSIPLAEYLPTSDIAQAHDLLEHLRSLQGWHWSIETMEVPTKPLYRVTIHTQYKRQVAYMTESLPLTISIACLLAID